MYSSFYFYNLLFLDYTKRRQEISVSDLYLYVT